MSERFGVNTFKVKVGRAPELDVAAVRAQFPYLDRPEGIVYLDSGASAQKPRPVAPPARNARPTRS